MIEIYEDNKSIKENLFNSIIEMVLNSNTNEGKKLKIIKTKTKKLNKQNILLNKQIKYKKFELKHLKVSIQNLESNIADLINKLNKKLEI